MDNCGTSQIIPFEINPSLQKVAKPIRAAIPSLKTYAPTQPVRAQVTG